MNNKLISDLYYKYYCATRQPISPSHRIETRNKIEKFCEFMNLNKNIKKTKKRIG